MTVLVAADGTIELTGVCGVDEAEVLLQALLTRPTASVNWNGCEWVHSAIVQVLLVAKVAPLGAPASAFLNDRIGPVLRR